MRMNPWKRLALAVVVPALVATACTNSSDTTTTAPSTSTEAPPTTATTTTSTTTTTTTEPPDPRLAEPIPVDDDVTIGTLANGLTYYVRENFRPGSRAQLRLVVDAGSAQESAEQSGGAHFLEHMLFNGTERFPANELTQVLESFGARFGPDVNAYTSFDETVYELSIATDDPAILELALALPAVPRTTEANESEPVATPIGLPSRPCCQATPSSLIGEARISLPPGWTIEARPETRWH